MSSQIGVCSVTLPAGEDLTGDLYKLAIVDATGRIAVNTTANGVVHGLVGEEVAAAGQSSSLIIPNGAIVKVLLGATLATPGVLLGSDNAGRVVAAGTALNNFAVGVLIKGGVANDVGEMLFMPVGRHGGAS